MGVSVDCIPPQFAACSIQEMIPITQRWHEVVSSRNEVHFESPQTFSTSLCISRITLDILSIIWGFNNTTVTSYHFYASLKKKKPKSPVVSLQLMMTRITLRYGCKSSRGKQIGLGRKPVRRPLDSLPNAGACLWLMSGATTCR